MEREAVYWPPSRIEIKNLWIYASTPVYIVNGELRHEEDFAFSGPYVRVIVLDLTVT
jgi:hypothetical protein